MKVLQKSPQPLKHRETLLGDKNISVGCGFVCWFNFVFRYMCILLNIDVFSTKFRCIPLLVTQKGAGQPVVSLVREGRSIGVYLR